jgi:hypothetical protein
MYIMHSWSLPHKNDEVCESHIFKIHNFQGKKHVLTKWFKHVVKMNFKNFDLKKNDQVKILSNFENELFTFENKKKFWKKIVYFKSLCI